MKVDLLKLGIRLFKLFDRKSSANIFKPDQI